MVQAFSVWASEQGIEPARAELRVQRLGRPHVPCALAPGWQGVYAFEYDEAWLKVGKAGPKSGARWISQHYNPGSAMSTLAFSFVKYGHFATDDHPSVPGLRAELSRTEAHHRGTGKPPQKRPTRDFLVTRGRSLGIGLRRARDHLQRACGP